MYKYAPYQQNGVTERFTFCILLSHNKQTAYAHVHDIRKIPGAIWLLGSGEKFNINLVWVMTAGEAGRQEQSGDKSIVTKDKVHTEMHDSEWIRRSQ